MNTRIILFVILFVGSSYLLGVLSAPYIPFSLFSQNEQGILYNKEVSQPANVDFSLFWEAWNAIEAKHIKRNSLDPQAMVYGAIRGLVRSLDDPYSAFLTPGEAKRFDEDITGSFDGIGVELSIKKGVITVISPLKDTPGQRAGIRAGDKIIKINETVTSDLSLDEAVNLIRGPKGTTVTLTIFREESDKTSEISVIRDTITVPALNWEIKKPDIIYLQIFTFGEKTEQDLGSAIPQMLNQGGKKIIIDLRNNPGGLLESAVKIASFFLKNDTLVVSERLADGKIEDEFRTEHDGALKTMPLVILVNRGTASASEILAEALRVGRGAALVGETTFGKGSVQELLPLGSSNLKLTVAEWLTPKGESINNNGLKPDISVNISEEDFEQGRDPQLDKALEIIRVQE